MKSPGVFIVILLGILLCGHAQADGVFKEPTLREVPIPGQVGVVHFAGGKETLTIWNTVEAGGQELAWVLPLPAAPELIRESHPAGVRLLQTMGAPEVTSVTIRGVTAGVFLFGLIAGGVLWWCRPRTAVAGVIVTGVLCGLIMVIASGVSDTFGPRDTPVVGVKILSVQQTGNYEVTVVEGASGESVNAWLAAAGFPGFDGGALAALNDYAARHWVFLCARLKAGGPGVAVTRPLTVRFPAEEPIYPMRLTAAAGTVPVDVYLTGDSPMTDVSGRLRVQRIVDRKERFLHSLDQRYTDEILLRLARDYPDRFTVSAPSGAMPVRNDADPLFEAVLASPMVTHLAGTFRPGGDWSDIRFAASGREAGPRLYLSGSVVAMAINRFGIPLGMFFVLSALAARLASRDRLRPPLSWRVAALIVFVSGVWVAWSVTGSGVQLVAFRDVAEGGSGRSAERLFEEWTAELRSLPPEQAK